MWSTTDTRRVGRKSYVRQLVEAFALLGLGMGVLLPMILFWSAWQQARLHSLQTAHELADILAEDARYALLVGSRPDAQALTATLLKFPDLIAVRLLDAEGRVVAEQVAEDAARARQTTRVEAQVLASRTHDASPALLGRVELTLSLDRALGLAWDSARGALLQLGVLVLLLGLAVARLTRRMLAPLASLVGQLDTPLETTLPAPPTTSPTEIHRLHAAVGRMRARLAANHRQLSRHAQELETRVAERTQALILARDAAEAANRAKTLFLANVSHELRTPLQAIILHARLLERAQPRTEPLAVIRHASDQLLALIEQLLNLSRVESGQPLELTYQQLILEDLLKEVVTTLRPTLAPGNQLVLECPETSATLISDRTRLLQVLYNLVRNADRFTEGGPIRLTLSLPDQERVRIQVSDAGIGIPAAELERIFEPFYQGSGGISGRVSSGIGLGLWLSRRLIEALGGQIQVSSTQGVGTCFTIDLPRVPTGTDDAAQTDRPAPDPDSTSRRSFQGCPLLLAEDEPAIRTALTRFLREAGFQLDECADGHAALALLESRSQPYAALVLDHRMPGIQGLDILARLRASDPHTPVVILTGDDRASLQAAIRQLDAQLLVKPIQPERLIETLATLIDPQASLAPDPTRDHG
ncbi:integral membrane sensor hybrid histidine kinase [Thiorhodococcus drewsii AZ1]|uniref:histidine kinase n=1 Tax=Thiorhodococcus drewsii AZ1 TaxID=765913 RepID=G2E6Y1_9GAMM|nr:ATP-binding protein [Thiorhodococcus drewsii]EGV28143.1 integral membrane sensor hybrid histidine kinase [Thiorhodococcus drewsii AZ1]